KALVLQKFPQESLQQHLISHKTAQGVLHADSRLLQPLSLFLVHYLSSCFWSYAFHISGSTVIKLRISSGLNTPHSPSRIIRRPPCTPGCSPGRRRRPPGTQSVPIW